MELDLDSIFQTISEDSDSDSNSNPLSSLPYCTVDDILNDSDSSSSSSSSTPPKSSSINNQSVTQQIADEQLVLDGSKSESRYEVWKPSAVVSRVGVDVRGSRGLRGLFGSVRANAKPCPALAAASTASRAIPTPHAAAIKLRRAGSESLKGVDESRVGESDSVKNELNSNGDLLKNDQKTNNLDVERSVGNLVIWMVCTIVDGLSLNTGDTEICKAGMVTLNGENGTGCVSEESIYLVSADTSTPSADHTSFDDKVGIGVVNSSSENLEHDSMFLESGVHESFFDTNLKHMEIGSDEQEGNLNTNSSEAASESDITEDVEDMIAEWTSKRIQMEEVKIAQPVLKPLEQAEELEKTRASAGLHWTEGATCQPMRLV